MSSFPYKPISLLYDNDDGSVSIKHQKLRVRPGTRDTFVPLTPLVMAREYTTSSQFEGTSVNARHLNLVIEEQEFKSIIPYGPANLSTLKSCIREILDHKSVFAGRYFGESLLNDYTANNHLP